MSDLPARNRVIYQSEALFVSPDTTGHHIYYMPPKKVQNVTEIGDCMITGTDVDGNEITFNACQGIGGVDPAKDFKFKTYSSNVYNEDGNELGLNGMHPVLADAGFSGAIEGGGLQYLTPDNDDPNEGAWGTAVEQLKRVQNANYSFTINRQDVNQFGHLGRLDAVVLEAPTVNMDFSYYLTDLENERLLGMATDGKFQNLSGMMTRSQNSFGNSFFILTVPEGRDAVGGDLIAKDENKTVISLGNGYVTDYSLEASVGSFPTASVSVEGLNIKSDVGVNFKEIPAIDPDDGTLICDRKFTLPPSETGQGESVLKPGDINIDLANAGLISKQISGTEMGYGSEDVGSAHVQSFTLSTPLGRTSLQRLGTTYTYAKEVDFPVTCTLSVNALVSDLKDGNLVDLICGKEYDLQVRMKNPQCVTCDPNSNPDAVVIDFKRAVLDSESFSSSIGDNKTVDLTFSTQIGGPEEKGIGVFISGFENQTGHDGLHKSFPMVSNTGDGLKYFKYGVEGTTGIGYSAQGEYTDGWSSELKDRTKTF
jgi:hypothetical protein